MSRVSTRRPPIENSFQNRIPAGNVQAAARDASITPPGGIDTQRRLVAPSDQSGYCGLNERMPGRTRSTESGSKRPVSRRLSGKGAGASLDAVADVARANVAATAAIAGPMLMARVYCAAAASNEMATRRQDAPA